MTDPDEASYLARASNLLATFRQIAQDEHPNVIAEAALAFLAESLANHPNRDEMVQHVLDQLRTIVDQIAEGEPLRVTRRLRLSSSRIFARKSGTANGLATGSRPGQGRSVCARTYPTADNAYSAPSRAVAAVYSFRPLAGRSLASVVVRTAERVA